MDLIIGIGEYAISKSKSDKLKTYALASCVAVTAYCAKRKTAGMVHVALPVEKSIRRHAMQPCYYADTGVPLLINKMCAEFGCPRNELEVNIFGGAKSVHSSDVFKIGEKNVTAVKEALSRLDIKYKTAEIGGTCSRTLEMDAETGEVRVFLLPLAI